MTWVREMVVGDAAAVSAVRVAGWRAAYAGVIPGAYLDAMSVERDAARREERFAARRAAGLCDLVAVGADGQVAGWACCGPRGAPGDGPGAGELYALYVRPGLLGRGVGRALLGAVHEEAAARGWGALAVGGRGQRPRPPLLRDGRVPGGQGRAERGVRGGGGAGGAVPAAGGPVPGRARPTVRCPSYRV
ncbi:GNAT family N-acetyltransferase [Streptomyces albidoflavus]